MPVPGWYKPHIMSGFYLNNLDPPKFNNFCTFGFLAANARKKKQNPQISIYFHIIFPVFLVSHDTSQAEHLAPNHRKLLEYAKIQKRSQAKKTAV